MTISGTSVAQQEAWRLIKELLGEVSTSQQSIDSAKRTKDEADIDFTNFDWSKANKASVCIIYSQF